MGRGSALRRHTGTERIAHTHTSRSATAATNISGTDRSRVQFALDTPAGWFVQGLRPGRGGGPCRGEQAEHHEPPPQPATGSGDPLSNPGSSLCEYVA